MDDADRAGIRRARSDRDAVCRVPQAGAGEITEVSEMNDLADSDISYTERELIQRAITGACARHTFDCNNGTAAPRQRWCVVKHAFGTGSTVSTAICYRYGFDAEKIIGGDE